MSQKKTFVTLEQLKEIDKTYPTPYHLYDEKGIRDNAKRLKEAFSWNKGPNCKFYKKIRYARRQVPPGIPLRGIVIRRPESRRTKYTSDFRGY